MGAMSSNIHWQYAAVIIIAGLLNYEMPCLGHSQNAVEMAVEISLALQCMKNPVPIGVGYLAQYIIKPFLGFCIAKAGVQLSCH